MPTNRIIGYSMAIAAVLIGLTLAVFHGMQSPSCEALYNEYTSTVDMSKRDAIFSRGMETGCFYNP